MERKQFNFPRPFRFGNGDELPPRQQDEISIKPISRDKEEEEFEDPPPPALTPALNPREKYNRNPPKSAFKPPYPPLAPANIEELENIDKLMGMDLEDLLLQDSAPKPTAPPPKPESYALPATFIERDENQEREAAIKMQVLVDKCKEFKEKIKELRDKNLEMAKGNYEKGQELEHLKLEKLQLEEELKSLGLLDKRGYQGGGLAIISRKALDDDENKRKLDMKRELMMGIALVEGDFADFLGKQESEKNCCDKFTDQIKSCFYKVVVLKGEMKRIEARYDKSISAYFSFYKFLVNSSIFILAIFMYLLISHILYYNGNFLGTCGGGPCFLLYSAFPTSEDISYCLSFICLIAATVCASIFKWVRTDYIRKKQEIFGGKDIKLKRFAAIVFNNWSWNIDTETDSYDQSQNISNQLTTALKDEAKLKEAANRSAAQKTALTIRRIIGSSIYILILIVGWVLIILILVYEKDFVNSIAPTGTWSLVVGFIPKLGISLINAAFPNLTIKITTLENWDSPSYIVKLQIIRIYIAKILNVVVFAGLNLALATDAVLLDIGEQIEYETNYNCREDQAGINLLLLVISEAVMSKVIPLVFILFNFILSKIRKVSSWKKQIKVSQQLINCIYFQALVWVTLPYFPYVAVLTPVLMFIDFKFQHWKLNKLQIKPLQQTQASDLVIFIIRVYNITLLGAIAYITFFLTADLPHKSYNNGSDLCGPFESHVSATTSIINAMTDRVVLKQLWLYALGYAPVFWGLVVIAIAKIFFLKNHLNVMVQYQDDREMELTHQIIDLQRANATLKKKEKLNKEMIN
ncbi:unnamed protein product [Blepharisma stoltei]|uniref:TMC domain-containing protein n=1 Tax=Blepharisma stoltei TaxID=1481888 RepID=A0AAU9K1U2_9CILI|nr:unnamed protein product [Blepharisma stoltei]